MEGSDVKMSCKSADGSDPINYKWERVLDKGKYVGKLPPLALIGKPSSPLHALSVCGCILCVDAMCMGATISLQDIMTSLS